MSELSANPAPGRADAPEEAPRKGFLPARVALAALMAVVGLNVWTGSPLLALWIGSRVQGDGGPTMLPIFVFAVTFLVLSLSLAWILSWLSAIYDRLTGQPPAVRQHTPWLRSMRGEREQYPGTRVHITTMERIVVAMVVAAVVAFEIWFFFFSTSPIDQRSGRGDAGLVA
jgi:hypothetical protein